MNHAPFWCIRKNGSFTLVYKEFIYIIHAVLLKRSVNYYYYYYYYLGLQVKGNL
jgi:hypothetical protein